MYDGAADLRIPLPVILVSVVMDMTKPGINLGVNA